MATENVELTDAAVAEPTANDLLARMETLAKRLEMGRSVEAAAGKSVAVVTEVADVAGGAVAKGAVLADEKPSTGFGLEETFETLARTNRSCKHFGTDAALSNPRAYLRQKNADGTFAVTNQEVAEALATALFAPEFAQASLRKSGDEMQFQKHLDRNGHRGMLETKLGGIVSKGAQGAFGHRSDLVSKALDTTTGNALIRVDLEDFLYETFLRFFPAYDLFPKTPANGLKHSWNQITATGDAFWTDELGSTIAAGYTQGTYQRSQSTDIGCATKPFAVGFKAQFAIRQSGMNYGASQGSTELRNALVAIARLVQTAMFQGNSTQAGGTLANEDGLLNALSFDGYRTQLKGATTSITKGGAQSFRDVLDQASGQLVNVGADATNLNLFYSTGASRAYNAELESSFLRVLSGREGLGAGNRLDRNMFANGLITVDDRVIRPNIVPSNATAEGIGDYTFAAAATEDMYLLDPAGNDLVYLGSPAPMVLQVPNGSLQNLAESSIPFMFVGLAIKQLLFNKKIRIAKQTV